MRGWIKGASRAGPVAVLLVAVVGNAAAADETALGSKEYMNSCAVCHGVNGDGQGLLAPLMTVKPADLTVLARKNGGEYPFLRVFQTIDGRTQVTGHGDRRMPVWGDRYEVETGVQPGTYGSEMMVRARVLELVYFVQSLQQK